jgi:hypothetical protein
MLHKNDKAVHLNGPKIFLYSEKCQAIDFIIFLASSWHKNSTQKFPSIYSTYMIYHDFLIILANKAPKINRTIFTHDRAVKHFHR